MLSVSFFLSVMEKLRLFFILISTLISSTLMATQQEVKALTVEQMQTAASQAHLQEILSIDSLVDAEDCRRHRNDVLMCANFVLDTPCELNEKSDLMWVYCARFVLLWDEKSDEILISFPKSSKEWMICPEMMSVFLSACTKTAIENKIMRVYSKEMHVKAVSTCVQYYIKHKTIMDVLCMPNMKKLVKKQKRGRLESFLSKQYDKEYKAFATKEQQTENFFIPE